MSVFAILKPKGMGTQRHILVTGVSSLVIGSLFACLSYATAHAITTISESYQSSTQIPVGSIVSLVKGSQTQVEPGVTSNADSLLGVVVNPDSSLLSVSTGSAEQTEVATSGILPILVTDINGTIQRGDHITASPVAGLGMLADGNVRVVGIAQGSMTSTRQQTITDTNGATQQVTIGEVPVLVNVAYFFKQPDKSIIPVAFQNIANSLAGRDVKPLPIIISGAIFIITAIVVMSIIFSMIRSSIISVGRNPMSQSAVYRDVIQLSALVLGILAVATVSIYLVLTRM